MELKREEALLLSLSAGRATNRRAEMQIFMFELLFNVTGLQKTEYFTI